MKLHYAPASPFVRKAMVTAIECGLRGKLTLSPTNPHQSTPDLVAANPFSKVPALELDSGDMIFESLLICEHLDEMAGGGVVFPKDKARRLPMLRRHALANGLMEVSVLRRVESVRGKDADRDKNIARQATITQRSLDILENAAATLDDTLDLSNLSFVIALLAAFPAGALAQTTAPADNFPSRPARFVVPFAPGRAVDILTRTVGQKLGEVWGQQVLIDNRPGAGGNIGAEAAARASADGYTILLGDAAHANAISLYPKLSYDFIKDFEPVTLAAITPLVIVTHPSLPVKTTQDLIQLARTSKEPLVLGTGGNGSATRSLSGNLKISSACICPRPSTRWRCVVMRRVRCKRWIAPSPVCR